MSNPSPQQPPSPPPQQPPPSQEPPTPRNITNNIRPNYPRHKPPFLNPLRRNFHRLQNRPPPRPKPILRVPFLIPPTFHPLHSPPRATLPPHAPPLLPPTPATPRIDFSQTFPRRIRSSGLFCADKAIDLLIKSGISQYIEYKAIDGSLNFDGEKRVLISVPDSRAAIFKTSLKDLSLIEKNKLNRLFKIVHNHLSGVELISNEDLEISFFEFLVKKEMSNKIIGIILYAIALADSDQENKACNDLLRTKDGIDRLALHHSSIGRFPNAPGAMLYPMYGQGELPQAFCRRAAVKGCIYVLRMPVAALLTDEDTGLYKGVRLTSGQELFSQKLIMDPDLVVPQPYASPTSKNSTKPSNNPDTRGSEKKVARAICITKTSMKSDLSNLLIVLPPRSLYPEQATTVRALQLSSNTAVCPVGMFVVHLSALCNDDNQGETLLTAAVDALIRQPTSATSNDNSDVGPSNNSDAPNSSHEDQRPVCEWRALYIQAITEGLIDKIGTTPSPDGNLSYNDLFDATEKMFQQMFPGEEFFPEQVPADDIEDKEPVNPE